jgi:hypothetical protein
MKRIIFFILLVSALLVTIFPANITIPSLEMTTKIFGYDGAPVVQTQTEMDITVDGGYKFGGSVIFGFDGFIGTVPDPSYGQTLPPLTFKAVSLTVRDLFGVPLSFSYFVGISDYICYGDDFSRLFGSPFIQSTYKASYNIFGTLNEIFYKGLHRINGNGIKLEFLAQDQPFGFTWYLYQDHNFVTISPLIDMGTLSPVINMNVLFYNSSMYSTDFRLLLNTESFKLEAFAGATLDFKTLTGYMRLGGLFYIGLGPIDFLIIAGIPQLDFTTAFGLDMFYILLESRMNFGLVNITPTIFFRPSRYLQQTNVDETNKIDFDLSIGLFNPRKDLISFGVENNFSTTDLFYSSPAISYRVLPFVTLATPGVYWEIKVSFLIYDSTTTMTMNQFLSSMQGIIDIRAEF